MKKARHTKPTSHTRHSRDQGDFRLVFGLALVLLGVLIVAQMITTGYHAQVNAGGY